jgi:hypothetical protein
VVGRRPGPRAARRHPHRQVRHRRRHPAARAWPGRTPPTTSQPKLPHRRGHGHRAPAHDGHVLIRRADRVPANQGGDLAPGLLPNVVRRGSRPCAREVFSALVTETPGASSAAPDGRPSADSPTLVTWAGCSPLNGDNNYAKRVNSGNRILRDALFRALH